MTGAERCADKLSRTAARESFERCSRAVLRARSGGSWRLRRLPGAEPPAGDRGGPSDPEAG
jgi:hypothetical protein